MELKEWDISEALDKLIGIVRHERAGQLTHIVAEIEANYKNLKRKAYLAGLESAESCLPEDLSFEEANKEAIEPDDYLSGYYKALSLTRSNIQKKKEDINKLRKY